MQNNKAVIQETYKTFSTVELTGENNHNNKVAECVEYIKIK